MGRDTHKRGGVIAMASRYGKIVLAVVLVLSLLTFHQVVRAPISQGAAGITYNPATDSLFLINSSQVYEYDREGRLIREFNVSGVGFGNGIAADPEGNLYITDEGSNNNVGKLLKLAPRASGGYDLVFTNDILSKLGIAPDDLTFDPESSHLFISSFDGGNKVFEVTSDGEEIVNSFVVGGGTGFGITLATSGSSRGNLFLTTYTNRPEIQILEITRAGTPVRAYSFTGGQCPADGIAFDPSTEKFWVADLCGNQVLYVDIATGEELPLPPRTPVEFQNMIAVPTDPTKIAYPDFYRNAQPMTVQLSDPECVVQSDTIYYPKDYLGSFPLPSLRGGPLPSDIKRGVAMVDVWGCCLDWPTLNPNCSGSMHEAYLETLRRTSLLGADHVLISNYTYVQDADSATPKVDLSDGWLQITESEMAFQAEEAHKRNLGVTLLINMVPVDEKGKPLPTSPARDWWATYLDSYGDFIFQQAQWAEKYNIDAMMLNNFDYEAPCHQPDYSDIIASKLLTTLQRVRSIYSGKVILYDCFSGSQDLSKLNQLFSKVDLILFTLANPWGLDDTENANLNTNLVLEKYNIQLRSYIQRYALYSKPVVIRVLLQSHRDYLKTGFIDTVAFCELKGNCAQFLAVKTDFSVQAIAYEAVFEAINKIHKHGLTVYAFDIYWSSYTDAMLPKSNFVNISQSIRNKPAESIVLHWFKR